MGHSSPFLYNFIDFLLALPRFGFKGIAIALFGECGMIKVLREHFRLESFEGLAFALLGHSLIVYQLPVAFVFPMTRKKQKIIRWLRLLHCKKARY